MSNTPSGEASSASLSDDQPAALGSTTPSSSRVEQPWRHARRTRETARLAVHSGQFVEKVSLR